MSEPLAERGLDAMRGAGLDVDVQIGLAPDQLLRAIVGAQALVIRSATQVTAEVLEAGADLIVVGTHGRTGLDRLLMGSVAERVIGFAACPVLAVKL